MTDELEDVAARLREERPEVDPLQLDRIKTTAMARAGRGRRTGFAGRRVVAAVLTVGLLGAGSGGVLAAGGFHHAGVNHQNAANAQYSSSTTTTTTTSTSTSTPITTHKKKPKKKKKAKHQRHVMPHFTG